MRGFCYGRTLILELGDIRSCRAFRTVNNLELYSRTLLEGFEAISINCCVVYEYVIATILLDKTKTLSVIKPFYCTFYHLYYSLLFAVHLEPLI